MVPARAACLTSPMAVDSLDGNLPISRSRVEMGPSPDGGVVRETEPGLIAASLALIGPAVALSPAEQAAAAGIAPELDGEIVAALRTEIESGGDPLGDAF